MTIMILRHLSSLTKVSQQSPAKLGSKLVLLGMNYSVNNQQFEPLLPQNPDDLCIPVTITYYILILNF